MIKKFNDLSYNEKFRVFLANSIWDDDAWNYAEEAAISCVEDDMAQTPYIKGYIGDRGEHIEVTDLNDFADWICAGNSGVIPVKTYDTIYALCEDYLNMPAYDDDYISDFAIDIKDDIEGCLYSWLKAEWNDMYDERFQFDVLYDLDDIDKYDFGDYWIDTDTWQVEPVGLLAV